MKNVIVLALMFALGATAQAKLAPVEAEAAAISLDDLATSSEPVGATRERDYFLAPDTTYAAGRTFPCRLMLFDKTRLAQSCR